MWPNLAKFCHFEKIFKSVWWLLKGFPSIWQIFEPTYAKYLCNCINFQIVKIILPSGHTRLMIHFFLTWHVSNDNCFVPYIMYRSAVHEKVEGDQDVLVPACFPIHPRLLVWSRFNLLLGLASSVAVIRLHAKGLHAVGWGEGPWG